MTERMVPVKLLEALLDDVGEPIYNADNYAKLRAIIDGPGVEPVGYIDAEQLRRWDILRGTEFESPERCLMPFSRVPFKSDMTDCSLPVFLAAPSAPVQEIEITDEMAYAFHRAIDDSPLGNSDVKDIKAGLRAAFANVVAPAQVVPDSWQLVPIHYKTMLAAAPQPPSTAQHSAVAYPEEDYWADQRLAAYATDKDK